MKEKIKNLPVIGRRLVGLYSRYLRLQNRKFLEKNRELKNRFAGRRCFVIATGPSIKTQDLKQLAGELSISVSNFFVHPDFKIIKPAYHIFAPSHAPITEEQCGLLFKDAESHFPDSQSVLVSITDKHVVDKYGVFKKQKLYYYSLGNRELKETDTLDFSKTIPRIQTSPHIAMYLAMFAGVSEMYLLGVDHDWILHLKETRHFYDEKKSVLTQAGYNEWQGHDLEVELRSYLSLWQIYKKMKSWAMKRGIKIWNITPGSLLDVFPRRQLEDVLKEMLLQKRHEKQS